MQLGWKAVKVGVLEAAKHNNSNYIYRTSTIKLSNPSKTADAEDKEV
jgi:hypothetical protein